MCLSITIVGRVALAATKTSQQQLIVLVNCQRISKSTHGLTATDRLITQHGQQKYKGR